MSFITLYPAWFSPCRVRHERGRESKVPAPSSFPISSAKGLVPDAGFSASIRSSSPRIWSSSLSFPAFLSALLNFLSLPFPVCFTSFPISRKSSRARGLWPGVMDVKINEGSECPQVHLWQLIDSAFPAGGLAHSNGLEASVQAGRVSGPEGLFKFAQENLHALTSNTLPLISAARSCTDLGEFLEVDCVCDSYLVMNHVARRASMAQGKGLMNAAAAALPFLGIKELKKILESRQAFSWHLAPIFGLVCRLLGVKELEARRVFLFMALRLVSDTPASLAPSFNIPAAFPRVQSPGRSASCCVRIRTEARYVAPGRACRRLSASACAVPWKGRPCRPDSPPAH